VTNAISPSGLPVVDANRMKESIPLSFLKKIIRNGNSFCAENSWGKTNNNYSYSPW